LGYDQPRSLGARETGGGATLPIWVDYMKTVLAGVKHQPVKVPEGVTKVKIDLLTGTKDPMFGHDEYFYVENLPPEPDPDLYFDQENGDLIEFLKRKAQGFFRMDGSGHHGQQQNPRQPIQQQPSQPGQRPQINWQRDQLSVPPARPSRQRPPSAARPQQNSPQNMRKIPLQTEGRQPTNSPAQDVPSAQSSPEQRSLLNTN